MDLTPYEAVLSIAACALGALGFFWEVGRAMVPEIRGH